MKTMIIEFEWREAELSHSTCEETNCLSIIITLPGNDELYLFFFHAEVPLILIRFLECAIEQVQ